MGNMKSCQKCRQKRGRNKDFSEEYPHMYETKQNCLYYCETDQQMLASITARGTAARRALLAGSFLGWITLNTDSMVASTK